MNNDINVNNQKKVVEDLSQILAETYVLHLKTQHFYWNVKGPWFQPLHSIFGSQAKELGDAVDAIAERIRALGFHAPGSFSEFQCLSPILQSLSPIDMASGEPQALKMVKELLDGHKTISQTAHDIDAIAVRYRDEGTADLMAQRIQDHDKISRTLESFLDEQLSQSKVSKFESPGFNRFYLSNYNNN
jgi:starvation-inducible DNA-binding protein